MGTSEPPPNVTKEETRRVFSRFESPCTPLSTDEVAEQLDCQQQVARQHLQGLAEDGDVQSRRLDGQRRVWWMATPPEADPSTDSQEFEEFIGAVEDYAIFMLGPEGTVRSWNDGAARIKGYSEAEIIGEHVSVFYTDEDVDDGLPERNLEAAASQGRVEDEGWRVRQDGSTFWANVTITAIRDEDGTLHGFTKVTRDMTEQREYEQQLREERDFTEQILETVPVSVFVTDTDGDPIRANERVFGRLGVDDSGLGQVDLNSWEIYDEQGDPISFDEWPWAQVLETGEPVRDFECQVDVPEMGRRWISINAVTLNDTQFDDDRIVFAVDDITRRKERERSLRREYNQTEKLLRTAPIAIAVQDSDGNTVMANQRAQEALGLSERELLDNRDHTEEWDIFNAQGESLAPSETPSARVLSTSAPVYNEELVIEPPDGERMHFRVNAAPIFGPDDDIERVITTGEDITELKRRERQLEQRKDELETQLSEILGRISDSFYALDDEWRFTHLNDSAAEIMQRPKAELLGRKVWEVFPDAEGDVFWEQFHTAMETQDPVDFEYFVEELGSWLEFTVYPSESGLSIYFRDITGRKERERRLNRHREYTDDILDAVDDIFYLLSEDGELQRWNASLCDVTGYADAEVGSMHATEFFGESDQAKIAEAVADGFETGNVQVEAAVRTKEGDHIPYEFVASTLEDPDGASVLAGIGRDITERREYEQKLEESNERLEQFAYAASHDLQEPLRMVSSYLQLIERRYANELDEDGREFIKFAVDGADRMREMIEGLLQYSRVDTRGDPFQRVDLNNVLADVREDLQMRIEGSNADIEAESLPTVTGDPGQLRQVFQNLLDNAIEYSGDDPPRIRVAAERVGDMWSVSVRDEGVGVDPSDADRIFEVFQSLENATEHSGTGIGLALCKRIVERHGGDIWVESTPGEGAKFTFTLPGEGK